MNGVAFAALLSHWRRNPLQLFTLLGGLALATGLWSGVQAVNAEARASYATAEKAVSEASFDQLVADDGKPLTDAEYVTLRRAGWRVSPLIEGHVGEVRLVGVDPLTAPGASVPMVLHDDGNLEGFLSPQGQVFGSVETIAALRAHASRIDARGAGEPDRAREQPATPFTAELVESEGIPEGVAYADIGVAQRLLGRPGEIDLLMVAAEQPLSRVPLTEVAPQLLLREGQSSAEIAQMTGSFHLSLTAFGLLSFAVGIFIVHSAIGLAFEQRRPVMRTVRVLGLSLRRLMLLVAMELLLLAIPAGVLGVGLGYLLAGALLPGVAVTLDGVYGAKVAGTLQFRPEWWFSALAIAVLGTALAAGSSFWQMARMPLVASAQPRAVVRVAGSQAGWQAFFALLLLSAAAVLAFTAESLLGGFAFLGCLLIGAALALPWLLHRVLGWLAARSRGVVLQWFWADTRQQLPGLSLAFMALLLAMATAVGVTTMVSSFRVTFLDFLDQRLASELYVSAQSEEEAQRIDTELAAEVDAILPLKTVDIEVAGFPAELYGVRDHATYRDNWRFLEASASPWDAVHGGHAVLINEQLARRAGFSVGDRIPLRGRSLEVVGIYGDYGNPFGKVIISEALFDALHPDVPVQRFGVRVADSEVERVRAFMRSSLGIPSSQIINQAGLKSLSVQIFDRTFVITAALNVLTLVVAAFALLMSLLTLATLRLPQLAPVWAMGFTRRQLGLVELARAASLALVTALLALPVGLVLAWGLLAIVNVAAFGWKLPLYVFPLDYLRLGCWMVLAALVAAVWPAWRLARTPPAALLQVFGNER